MQASEQSKLRKLARLYDISASYLDVTQTRREASDETLMAILNTLGCDINDPPEAEGLTEEEHVRRARGGVDPVLTAFQGESVVVKLTLPKEEVSDTILFTLTAGANAAASVELETSRIENQRIISTRAGGFLEIETRFDHSLPFGYHTLEIETGDCRFESTVISAPARGSSRRLRKRSYGAFLPLYALQSTDNWGAGNFTDLESLLKWTSDNGGSFFGTTPLLPTFLDEPFEPSPYSPVSRLFWNEFYIDVTRIPELEKCDAARNLVNSSAFQDEIEKLRKSRLVDYSSQNRIKRRVLEELSEFFFKNAGAERDEFETFLNRKPELREYARFRACAEKMQTTWHNWPKRLQDGRITPRDFDAKVERYYLYSQWRAHEQFNRASETADAHDVRLYLDLPLGTHPAGYDTWANKDSFLAGAHAGAPPDTFFTKGQNWGFQPLHPRKIRENRYRHLSKILKHHFNHARMLRIDHVMSFHRLYCIPDSFPATDGAYINYRPDELYAVLLLEASKADGIVIGENLGTVPPEVNSSIKHHGLRGMYVLQYELDPSGKKPFRDVPRRSMTSLNTHDMPPFAAFWNGTDINLRRRLGLMSEEEASLESRQREKLKRNIIQYLHITRCLEEREPTLGDVVRGCTRFLYKRNPEFTMVNLEDLILETEPQNVPGTSHEYPNWRRKLKTSSEEYFADIGLKDLFHSNSITSKHFTKENQS